MVKSLDYLKDKDVEGSMYVIEAIFRLAHPYQNEVFHHSHNLCHNNKVIDMMVRIFGLDDIIGQITRENKH